jgi:hypothetical protein
MRNPLDVVFAKKGHICVDHTVEFISQSSMVPKLKAAGKTVPKTAYRPFSLSTQSQVTSTTAEFVIPTFASW